MIHPKHLTKTIKGDYRIIVISDIHGHYNEFVHLLKKVNYTNDDYLVILGDFVEKGDQVLETIHFIKELDKNERTFVLMGNCEWALDALLTIPELAIEIPRYFQRVKQNGIIRQKYHEFHLEDGRETHLGAQKMIAESLKEELYYISHLPVTLKINDFIFVHAGLERRDYKNSSLSSLLEMQRFYELGHILDETVIVGHLPTSNYHKYHISNDIIIDLDKKIISIDGGTGVKRISQLNALIIENKDNHIEYKTDYVQLLPEYKVIKDINVEHHHTHKIAFPYFKINILEKGDQFTLCYQPDTNQTLFIKNEFIYLDNNDYYCLDDYTDYMFSLKKNDIVKVIDIYDEYAYIIFNRQVGWIKKDYLCIK